MDHNTELSLVVKTCHNKPEFALRLFIDWGLLLIRSALQAVLHGSVNSRDGPGVGGTDKEYPFNERVCVFRKDGLSKATMS